MENVTGAAISQQPPSSSSLMALWDCVLSNEAIAGKAALAQSFSKSQTLVAPEFITTQQPVCLCRARKSPVAADRASPASGA